MMSLWLSTTLKKVLPFRSVELALDGRCSVAQKSAEIVDAPVLPIKEHEVIQAIPEERVSEKIVEQSVDACVPQMRREIVEVIQPVLVERIISRVADHMVDIPVPPVKKEIVAVVQEEERTAPRERVPQQTVEQVPVPQILEEAVEVVLGPTERVQQRTVEYVPASERQVTEETVVVAVVPNERVQQWSVDASMPQVLEETVEVVRLAPHARVQQRTAGANWGYTSVSGRDRGGEVVPTRTSAVDRRAKCRGANFTNYGGDCRRVQNCTTRTFIFLERDCKRRVDVSGPQVDVQDLLVPPTSKHESRSAGIDQCVRTKRQSRKCACSWPSCSNRSI